jgi:electron transfer flavoprotein alpha subunit
MFLVGAESALPAYNGTLYLADAGKYGEFNPAVHKQLLLDVIAKEQPDMVVFSHSSYGWDLAPRISLALNAAHVSEVIDIVDGVPVVPACNSKLRRDVKAKTAQMVLTLQGGAFGLEGEPSGNPTVVSINTEASAQIEFCGYEEAEAGGVDLSKAEVIVSAGRGIGKPENLAIIEDLAKALKGEYGASRPVVDSEWADHSRQVGTTGQTVSPKLYVACGISGAIQHLAGMKKSEFIVAINTDKDAPIGEVADVLIVADLKEFVPALTAKLESL